MARPNPITACDCETDPFLHNRIPAPFLWGFYNGKDFKLFASTDEFVAFISTQKVICYAHNGGKYDFMYLLKYAVKLAENGIVKVQIINGRIVSMQFGEAQLIDSYAAVPESMKKIEKDEIEYWKMEAEVRGQHMPEIIKYLKSDCVNLYNLMQSYREAAGTHKTIASNALAYAKKLGLKPGTTNHSFDNDFRPFYFGGRTQCFKPGTFQNISVVDIISSYPFAMMQDHPSGSARHCRSSLKSLSVEEIQRAFIRLQCVSSGAFPTRGNGAQGLNFPNSKQEFTVTGWEYLAAKELGLITSEHIIQVKVCEGWINFSPYVQHWFEYKQSHPKKIFPIEYTIGKIMMNSLYGKMAQNPSKYFDYRIVEPGAKLPCRTPIEDENDTCKICSFAIMDHGWKPYTKYEGQQFHRRESLWKYKFRYGEDWESKPLYKNVATGASITGFARANLLRAIHSIGLDNCIYCDTDSIVCTENADLSRLPMNNKLGDWQLEIDRAPLAHFAGKKLYGIDLGNGKACTCGNPQKPCERHKVVTKGARLTFKDMARIVAGETITYNQEAPSFSISRGETSFPIRKIKRTGEFDS